jgi:hypothetical protein
MSDLGSVGLVLPAVTGRKSKRALMATGAVRAGTDVPAFPDFSLVETPVPVTPAGLNAFVFQGPGRFTWQTPVDPGLVTVSVQMRKGSGYGSLQLPYLELAACGQLVQTTMVDVTDTYTTVSAALTIREITVMEVSVVRPWPQYGSNFAQVFLNASDERRRLNPGALYVAGFTLE